MGRLFQLLICLVPLFSLVSCSTLRRAEDHRSHRTLQEARSVLEQICSLGAKSITSKGDLWMKAKSPKSSGQFSAVFQAERDGPFTLDVLNPFGGTEARIQVRSGKYQIQGGTNSGVNQGKVLQAGDQTWSGIPLEWVSSLLLGQVPCPDQNGTITSGMSERPLEWIRSERGEWILNVRVKRPGRKSVEEVYQYWIESQAEREWPKALEWTRGGSHPQKVRFEFSDPHPDWGVPRKWSASSDQGSVSVKWRNVEMIFAREGSATTGRSP